MPLNTAADLAYRIDPGARRSAKGDYLCSCPNKANHKNGDRSKGFSILDADNLLGVIWYCQKCDKDTMERFMLDSDLLNKPTTIKANVKSFVLGDAEKQALERMKRDAEKRRNANALIEVDDLSKDEVKKEPFFVDVYPYDDEKGNPYVRVIRFQFRNAPGKITPPSHLNSAGQWDKGLYPHTWQLIDGQRKWLPDLTQAPIFVPLMNIQEVLRRAKRGEQIHLFEGEGKAKLMNLAGVFSTCHIGGAKKKWDQAWTYSLYGAEVIVVCDNNAVGLAWGRNICRELIAAGIKCKLIILPNLVNEKDDIKEWLQTHTLDQFKRLVKRTEYFGTDSLEPEEITLEFDTFSNTDMANGYRLAKRFGRDLRANERGIFHYDGRIFVDNKSQIMKLAKKSAAMIFDEAMKAKGAERTRLFECAKSAQSLLKLEAAITLCQDDIQCPVSEFNKDPLLFPCQNGVLDLRSGELLDHSRRHLITQISPVVFNPSAKCPVFDEFLKHFTCGDDELIQFLWRAIGLTMTGLTSEEHVYFLDGDGEVGKSTIIRTLYTLMGTMAKAIPTEALMVHYNQNAANYELASLLWARFVCASETESGQRIAEAKMKRITGSNVIRCRHPNGDFFDYVPTFKLWMEGNYKPAIRGQDKGIKRRILIIPCEAVVTEKMKDRNLFYKICQELAGIVNKGLIGFSDFWALAEDGRDGMRVSSRVKDAVNDYFVDNDAVGPLIAEHCIFGERLSIRGKDLFQIYLNHCAQVREQNPMSDRQFYENIERRKLKGVVAVKTRYGKWFKGMGVRGVQPSAPPSDGEEVV